MVTFSTSPASSSRRPCKHSRSADPENQNGTAAAGVDRVRLTNIHNTNLQRLNYSLEVANAAGIKKPVYSNGQAVKDDPDYSVALGADGIAQKLQIEKISRTFLS